MKFATILKSLLLLTAMSLLVACGGGTSGGDSAFQAPQLKISATPTATTVESGGHIDVAVRVTQANGANVPDGTTVSSTVTPASNGILESIQNGVAGGNVGQTVGGIANFRFTAAGPGGNTSLTFSVTDPAAPGRATATTVAINVTPAPPPVDVVYQIEVERVPDTIAANGHSDIRVTVKEANGTPVPDGTVVTASAFPSSLGQFEEVEVETVAGQALFRYQGNGLEGEVELRFSVKLGVSDQPIVATAILVLTPIDIGMTVELVPAIIPINGHSDIRVTVRSVDGNLVPDGTLVTGSAFPSSLGHFEATQVETVAGQALFRYQGAGHEGEVELRFSANVSSSGQPVVVTAMLQLAPTDDARLKLQATRTKLPVNQFGVDPFMGSPYMAEVTVTVKDGNGQPVNQPDGIQVSINPVGNTGGFTTLDDPETECDMETLEGCEFYIRMGQAPVDVVAGKATIFVHSLNFTGLTTLTVTTQDPVSGTTVAASMEFEIVESVVPAPTRLNLVAPRDPIYAQGSGGNGSGLLHVELADALGQPVPDPEAGSAAFNNYRLEIVGDNLQGAPRLNGVNAAGVSVTGTSIDLRTTAGVGAANLIAGDGVGSFVIRLTADRADNNVDNGLSDPVVLERSVVVSDGQLYDVEITRPTVNTLTVNPVGGEIEVVGGISIPVAPDGTYSVTVGVIATDRLGNPVIPGTRINFGLVDEPQDIGVGDFYMAGGDGDPQEGGTLFTADSGRFTTAGGGAGPGDTLLILAEDVIGNNDMEAARTVTEVHNRRSLSVNYRFNHNDTTGRSVDSGGILPYIIGRAADGNIVATATTNEIGVATTKMNYPVSKLGKIAAIWAQGDGPVVAGQPKKVADVEYARFSGVAGENARLVVSPNVLPANTTLNVTICVYDALDAPMGNLAIDFNFVGLLGIGKVDGTSMAGTVNNLTSLGSGCTVAEVSTSAMLEGEGDARLVFSTGGLSDEVTFSYSQLVLLANPSSMTSGGSVVLTLLDAAGRPQPGIQLVGSCTSAGGAAVGLASGPGVTSSQGRTTVLIDAFDLNQVGGAGSGQCVFSTPDGSATATVTLQGSDMCTFGVSPPIPGCEDEDSRVTHSLDMTVEVSVGSPAGAYTTLSAPNGIACTNYGGSGGAVNCSGEFLTGTIVTLMATQPPGAIFSGWAGSCAPVVGNPMQATVVMDGDRSCTATWSDVPQPATQTLSLRVSVGVGVPVAQYTVTATPGGEACTNYGTSGSTVSCAINFPAGTVVTLSTNPAPPGVQFRGWAGACDPIAGYPTQATVIMDGARTCSATWE